LIHFPSKDRASRRAAAARSSNAGSSASTPATSPAAAAAPARASAAANGSRSRPGGASEASAAQSGCGPTFVVDQARHQLARRRGTARVPPIARRPDQTLDQIVTQAREPGVDVGGVGGRGDHP
jgi:hypothetical protein